ncbi:MAG: DUF4328 domain-containing protein [Betaproteobacteria bacterium]|nr:DUF4328 domain-containing protein [Betaproteobacteria bacterium]
MLENQQGFKDSSCLTKWAMWLLYAQIVIGVIAVISSLFEYQVLLNLKNDAYASQELAEAAANASDIRQRLIGMIQILLYFTSAVLIAMWIYRANQNARQLGAEDMKFTPGWSVGWYFVPILDLWKPYQAMKEIWKASANPSAWKTQPVSSLLPWWWFFWIVSICLARVTYQLSSKEKEIEDGIVVNVISQLSDLSNITLTIILIAIIGKIYKMQKLRAEQRQENARIAIDPFTTS